MPARILPQEEVKFAARLGFLTKALWREFFAKGVKSWQDKRWAYLKKSGLFIAHEKMPDILLPIPNNRLVRGCGHFVSRPPVLMQLDHDEFVGRSDILLRRHLPDATVEVEAELKRLQPLRNKGKSILDQRKHPDLLVWFRGRKVAIEIELTVKSRARYKQILRSYRHAEVYSVIYVITSGTAESAIRWAASDVSFPETQILLGFCSLAEWRQNPLVTKVNFKNSSKTFAEHIGA